MSLEATEFGMRQKPMYMIENSLYRDRRLRIRLRSKYGAITEPMYPLWPVISTRFAVSCRYDCLC